MRISCSCTSKIGTWPIQYNSLCFYIRCVTQNHSQDLPRGENTVWLPTCIIFLTLFFLLAGTRHVPIWVLWFLFYVFFIELLFKCFHLPSCIMSLSITQISPVINRFAPQKVYLHFNADNCQYICHLESDDLCIVCVCVCERDRERERDCVSKITGAILLIWLACKIWEGQVCLARINDFGA